MPMICDILRVAGTKFSPGLGQYKTARVTEAAKFAVSKGRFTSISLLMLCFVTNVAYCVENDVGKFEQVFSIIAAPNIFSSSVEQVQQKLSGLCDRSTLPDAERIKHGNMVCVKELKIDLLTISGGGNIGFVSAIFSRSGDCYFIRRTLVANFGKPNKVSGECMMDWDLKPLKKGGQRHVGFEVDKNENRTYLSIGEDQGHY